MPPARSLRPVSDVRPFLAGLVETAAKGISDLVFVLDPVVFRTQVVGGFQDGLARPQQDPLAHLDGIVGTRVVINQALEKVSQRTLHRQGDVHLISLAHGVAQDAQLPVLRGDGRLEVHVHRLQPQPWLRRLLPIAHSPQQAPVRPSHGVVFPVRIAHQDDLVPCIAQQRKNALSFKIEAMGRSSDFRGPEETQLSRRVFMGHQATCMIH
mmetsp:Transcript_43764/g.69589  ORF Transcript_43764/g.69589 Transcript_43764/m.69589 type:complete len:210 (-) Transcript_43764:629-1258(-)